MVLPYSFRDRSSMAVLSNAGLLLICALSCHASYTFFQTYHSYSNPSHARADGLCCDEPGAPPCDTVCDNRFTLCVRHSGQSLPESVDSLQETDCSLGFVISTVFNNNDNITFNTLIPVEFTGDLWPTAFQLLVSVEDDDSRSDDDFVDVVVVDMSLSPSPSPTGPTEYLSRDGVCSFTISFRVECSEGLFGEDCSVVCEPRNDPLGHFTCGSGGERVCLDGYRDPETNCTKCVPLSDLQAQYAIPAPGHDPSSCGFEFEGSDSSGDIGCGEECKSSTGTPASLPVLVGVAGAALVFISAAVITITVLVCLRRRSKGPDLVDNVAYITSTRKETTHENKESEGDVLIFTSPNEAYGTAAKVDVATDVLTSTNPAYQVHILPSTSEAYDTATNEHDVTDVSLSMNPAYQTAQGQSGGDNFIYDYPRTD